jgi:hypothetical protein
MMGLGLKNFVKNWGIGKGGGRRGRRRREDGAGGLCCCWRNDVRRTAAEWMPKWWRRRRRSIRPKKDQQTHKPICREEKGEVTGKCKNVMIDFRRWKGHLGWSK